MTKGEALEKSMRFELEPTLRGSTDAELLEELRVCAAQRGRDTITMAEFTKIGKGHPTTITRRFSSWTRALRLAGLQPSRSKIGISKDELFDNLRTVWISLNRQPKYGEVKSPLSKYSAGTYEKRFGTWSNGLTEFINWTKKEDSSLEDESQKEKRTAVANRSSKDRTPHRTRRDISERQRFSVLLNSGFKCQSCGASPLSSPGTELHVDHIIPWSKGGETVNDNLICKCKRCNLGKGNAFEY